MTRSNHFVEFRLVPAKMKKKNKSNKRFTIFYLEGKDGMTVADGWAGAVMQKPLEIQKYLLRVGVVSRFHD